MTLIAMAEEAPSDKASLLALPGVGERKAEQYGAAFLKVIEGHATG